MFRYSYIEDNFLDFCYRFPLFGRSVFDDVLFYYVISMVFIPYPLP